MSPKANCAIYSAHLLYVCASRGGLPYFGEFFPVNRVIYSSLCAFFASQSELRHLQSTVSVCVCVCLHMILGQMPNFGKFFLVNRVTVFTARCLNFRSPKVNCAIYSAQLVYECACI